MGRAVYLALPDDIREALVRVAEREYRDPRDQAALFVVDGLRRANALPVGQDNTDRPVSDKAAALTATA